MTIVECGHAPAAFGALVCAHLLQRPERAHQYQRWLTGVGLEAQLLCSACSVQREQGAAVPLLAACQACLDLLKDETGICVGIRGTPGITERPEPLPAELTETMLPLGDHDVLDLAPIRGLPGSQWLLLATTGTLYHLHIDEGTFASVGRVPLVAEPDHRPWAGHALAPRLYVSDYGRFAAVVNDYGRRGVVLSVAEAKVTLELDGGAYHCETVPFSFCFLEHGGRTLVLHRTAWNRLDVSDAGSGGLLTARNPTSYRRGEERPAHYLDYFHGRLIPSPDGMHVVDDGWVWHPVGIPTVWSLRAWLAANPWESEDGPSRLALCARDYYWDHAICWIGSDRIAVGGIGDDDVEIVDGVRLFAPEAIGPSARIWWRSAREVGAFAGPRGTFFSDGRRLCSVDEDKLSVRDVEAGARTGTIAGFRPTRQHAEARQLVELAGRTLRRWTYA